MTETFPEDQFEVSVEDVKRALEAKDYTLIDVREAFELSRGKLPSAQEFPMSGLLATVGKLDKERPVIVYCEHGIRSLDVTYWLREQGYRAWSMTGGFSDWNGPVELGG